MRQIGLVARAFEVWGSAHAFRAFIPGWGMFGAGSSAARATVQSSMHPPAAPRLARSIEYEMAPAVAPVGPTPPPRRAWRSDYLGFENACEPGPRAIIAAVGDVLVHPELQRQAFRARDRYRVLWNGVEDLLARADVTYANLEGPTARGITRDFELVDDPGPRFDNRVYTGYALFNYHPALIEALGRSGVDLVSTANNHALDRGPLGIDRTIDALDEAGMNHTGTHREGEDGAWHTVTE